MELFLRQFFEVLDELVQFVGEEGDCEHFLYEFLHNLAI